MPSARTEPFEVPRPQGQHRADRQSGRDGHNDIRPNGWWKQDLSGRRTWGRKFQPARGVYAFENRVVEQTPFAANSNQGHLLAGTVGEPETEVPGGGAIDDLQTESLSAPNREPISRRISATAPGADGVPARAPTFTPLVSTVCPSLIRPAGAMRLGTSPAAYEAGAGAAPSSSTAVGSSQRFAGVGPGCDVTPLSHSAPAQRRRTRRCSSPGPCTP